MNSDSEFASSPKWIRGAVVSLYQWAITFGLLLAAIVNNATQSRDDHSAYRIPIAVQFILAFVLACGMLILPEVCFYHESSTSSLLTTSCSQSPRWLIKRGRDADAARSLGRLTSLAPADPIVEAELDEIRANLAEERRLGESSYLDCFKPSHNRIALRTLTGIFIQAYVFISPYQERFANLTAHSYIPDGNNSRGSISSSIMERPSSRIRASAMPS